MAAKRPEDLLFRCAGEGKQVLRSLRSHQDDMLGSSLRVT